MPAESLANHLRELDGDSLRSVVQYEGDEYDVVFQREDLQAEFSETEFEQVAKNLVLKGFDDPLEQPEFARFGHLDATVRWFHEVIVLQVPLDEWSGIIVAFDRESIDDTGQLVDAILEYVDTEFENHGDSRDGVDEFADEFS